MSLLLLSPLGAQEAEPWPDDDWPRAEPQALGLDKTLLSQARDYALTGGGSGFVVFKGRQVMSWGDIDRRYDLKSTTKSFGATALGVALLDGKVQLTDTARKHHPSFGVPPEENAETGWRDEITLLHLATHTAGFEKPGGYTKLLSRPGTEWAYSDGGPNWLAECLTLVYRRDLNDWMFQRVFTPLGIKPDDLVWRRNAYRPAEIEGIPRREFGSGISANVDAMARIGLLYLRDGRWREQRILSPEFIDQASRPVPQFAELPERDPDQHGNASQHYGLLWWNNADGALGRVPRDAYWTWGLYDSLIVVVPSLDLVVARAGQSWQRGENDEHYAVLEPFLVPLTKAAAQAQ